MVNFKDLPDTSTPINASNLNKAQEVEYLEDAGVKIGKWFGNKDLYRKVITLTLGTTTYDTWKSSQKYVWYGKLKAIEWALVTTSDGNAKRLLPYYDDSKNGIGIKAYIWGDQFIVRTNSTEFNNGTVIASILYTLD